VGGSVNEIEALGELKDLLERAFPLCLAQKIGLSRGEEVREKWARRCRLINEEESVERGGRE
jgi:hypothetical protein